MSELKPCPLCKRIPSLVFFSMPGWEWRDGIDGLKITCICGLSTSMWFSKEELIKYWNTRHGETAVLDEVIGKIEDESIYPELCGVGRAIIIIKDQIEVMKGGTDE